MVTNLEPSWTAIGAPTVVRIALINFVYLSGGKLLQRGSLQISHHETRTLFIRDLKEQHSRSNNVVGVSEVDPNGKGVRISKIELLLISLFSPFS